MYANICWLVIVLHGPYLVARETRSVLVASGSVIGALTVEFILQAPDNSPIYEIGSSHARFLIIT